MDQPTPTECRIFAAADAKGTLPDSGNGITRREMTRTINRGLTKGWLTPLERSEGGRMRFRLTDAGRRVLADAGDTPGKTAPPAPALPEPLPRLKVTNLAQALTVLTGETVTPGRYAYKRDYLRRLADLMEERGLSAGQVLAAMGVTAITDSGTPLRGTTPSDTPCAPRPPSKPRLALPPEGSKLRIMADLIRRPQGATLAQIARATGWQPHSVRGAIAGPLRKKFGLTIARERNMAGETVYRLEES